MALAEAAKLIATLDLGGNFVKNLGSADRALGKFDTHIDRSQSKAYQAGQKIGTGIKAGAAIAAAGVGILAFNIGEGLKSLEDLEVQTAQTNAVLKSTKGAAGVSAQAVSDLADKYEALGGVIDDKAIRSTENMLLTFTQIKGKAFEPALKAILDINTAMGGGQEGLQKVAIQVGKALNDPAKGLTALTRIGVTFDKGQVKRIKQLQKEGKTYEAQQIILAELNKEFGGSFLAKGDTIAGKVGKFNNAIDKLQQALASALLPALGNVADALTKFLSDPQTINDIRNLGQDIGKLFSRENIQKGIDVLKTGFQFLKDAAGAIKDIVGTAVGAFTSLPPEVQKLLVGGFVANKLTGGLVTDLIEGVAKTALNKIGLMTVTAGVVNVTGGVGGVPAGAAGAAGAASKGLGAIAKVALVAEAVGLVVAVNDVRQAISDGSSAQATAVQDSTNQLIANQPPIDDLKTALAGVNQGIHDLEFNPLNVLVQGDALDKLRQMREDLQKAIAAREAIPASQKDDRPKIAFQELTDAGKKLTQAADRWNKAAAQRDDRPRIPPPIDMATIIKAAQKDDRPRITSKDIEDSFDRAIVPTKLAVDGVEGAVNTGTDNINRSTGAVENAVKAADQQISSSGQLVQGAAALAGYRAASATNAAASGIEATIRANRPIIDVQVNISATSVEKTVVVNDRNGPSGGSATDDLGYPGHPGR